MKKTKNITIGNQSGSTLIESLVSLVILAIAVIGMLGVQVRTLMETNTAAGRAQAILLIDDLSERIRANPGGYSVLPDYRFQETTPVSAVDCTATVCDAAMLAQYDVSRWLENFKATVPNGKVSAFVSQDNPRQLGVLVGWTIREKDTDVLGDYFKNFDIPTAALNGAMQCWSGYICHLMYIEP